MTKFSVLLSAYSRENPSYLKEALNSILSQSLFPNEIILVKDGPLTQELDLVIKDYISKYPIIKAIDLEENQGLGKALNKGLQFCSNDLIARMDTDDIAKPNRFERQIQIFEKYPEIDVCSSWIEEFEENTNNILSIKKLPETHSEIVRYAKHRCPINHPVVMYKKEAVLKVGGYEGFPEDYRLWIKMLMNGSKFYNIQESLLYFRFSKDMIKRRGGWKYAINDIKSQLSFYRMGFLSLPILLYNIGIRIIVRLVPNSLRTFIYKKCLRK